MEKCNNKKHGKDCNCNDKPCADYVPKHSKLPKFKMGHIETNCVLYAEGFVAHRPRKDGNPEFTDGQLPLIVKACNAYPKLVEALKTALSDLKYYKAVEDSLSQTNIRLLDPTSTIDKAYATLKEAGEL